MKSIVLTTAALIALALPATAERAQHSIAPEETGQVLVIGSDRSSRFDMAFMHFDSDADGPNDRIGRSGVAAHDRASLLAQDIFARIRAEGRADD